MAETLDDIDMIYDEALAVKAPKKAHKRSTGSKHIKVRSSLEVAKDEYKSARNVHKAQIKRAKRAIKQHKLMIKQARGTYKLIRLSAS